MIAAHTVQRALACDNCISDKVGNEWSHHMHSPTPQAVLILVASTHPPSRATAAVAAARLLGDESPETRQVLAKYNIMEVPTFLFFRQGKEVMRHVGSSRGDLIGKILEVQSAFGVAPPPPPAAAGVQRRVRSAQQ